MVSWCQEEFKQPVYPSEVQATDRNKAVDSIDHKTMRQMKLGRGKITTSLFLAPRCSLDTTGRSTEKMPEEERKFPGIQEAAKRVGQARKEAFLLKEM